MKKIIGCDPSSARSSLWWAKVHSVPQTPGSWFWISEYSRKPNNEWLILWFLHAKTQKGIVWTWDCSPISSLSSAGTWAEAEPLCSGINTAKLQNNLVFLFPCSPSCGSALPWAAAGFQQDPLADPWHFWAPRAAQLSVVFDGALWMLHIAAHLAPFAHP